MRILYEILYQETERNSQYVSWKSIKLIEAILCKIGKAVLNMNIAVIMSPLYILHDYRIFFDHLLSDKKISEIKQHIVETLEIQDFSKQEAIYIEEIKRLNLLFKYLAFLSK